MTNYKRRYVTLLKVLEQTLTTEQMEEVLRRAWVTEENGDFMERLMPYTDEQMDALWGDIPMTGELVRGILYHCAHWNDLDAMSDIYHRYAHLVGSMNEEFERAAPELGEWDAMIKLLLQDVTELWDIMRRKK